MSDSVLLGFEVGTGSPVRIPVAHTFVTGQTRNSGKTTTLRAIVERSQRRAIAFITKRGESFEGRRIKPFLPREGERPLPWRLVESIMAGALGQKNMKWERGSIVVVTKGATTLGKVRHNISHRMEKSRAGSKTHEQYMLLGEYLDLILPEMTQLDATDKLDLRAGLNVMDLGGVSAQLQAIVIRAAIERINLHETDTLVVFPEAWEFAPRGREAPAKTEAIALARKGGAVGNFILADSQDISGVDTVVRQACSIWLLGVQRELNELKRNLASMAAGVKKPKPADVMTLQQGQFFACWENHVIKTYVQPPWMGEAEARAVAMGKAQASPEPEHEISRPSPAEFKSSTVEELKGEENTESGADLAEDEPFTDEDEMSKEDVDELKSGMAELAGAVKQLVRVTEKAKVAMGADHDEPKAHAAESNGHLSDELFAQIKERLIAQAPATLKILAKRPELDVEIERETIEANGSSLRGRVARLIAKKFFDNGVTHAVTKKELERTGNEVNNGNLSRELSGLVAMGFLTWEEGKLYKTAPGAKVNIREKESKE